MRNNVEVYVSKYMSSVVDYLNARNEMSFRVFVGYRDSVMEVDHEYNKILDVWMLGDFIDLSTSQAADIILEGGNA